MRLIFGWHISLKRLYFKTSRVEYQVRLWHRVKYRRPHKIQIIVPKFSTVTAEELTEGTDIRRFPSISKEVK